jgi:hypothetical protein
MSLETRRWEWRAKAMEAECGTLGLCDICCSCFLFPRLRDVWEEEGGAIYRWGAGRTAVGDGGEGRRRGAFGRPEGLSGEG